MRKSTEIYNWANKPPPLDNNPLKKYLILKKY